MSSFNGHKENRFASYHPEELNLQIDIHGINVFSNTTKDDFFSVVAISISKEANKKLEQRPR